MHCLKRNFLKYSTQYLVIQYLISSIHVIQFDIQSTMHKELSRPCDELCPRLQTYRMICITVCMTLWCYVYVCKSASTGPSCSTLQLWHLDEVGSVASVLNKNKTFCRCFCKFFSAFSRLQYASSYQLNCGTLMRFPSNGTFLPQDLSKIGFVYVYSRVCLQ